MLGAYQSHEIDDVWYRVSPLIQRVIDKVDLVYTLDDIRDSLKGQEMQLWVEYKDTLNSICVTRIVTNPKYKFLEIILNAGNLASVPFLEGIEIWAKSQGCKKISLILDRDWETCT